MKRPLTFVALGLILLGTEVATGAVSLAGARLWSGFGAALGGEASGVPAARYFTGAALLLGGLALYAAILWAETERRTISADGEHCPKCGTVTRRVRRRKRHRVLSRMLEANVTRRLCEQCGWSGLAA